MTDPVNKKWAGVFRKTTSFVVVLFASLGCSTNPADLMSKPPSASNNLTGDQREIAECVKFELTTKNPGADSASQGLGEDVRLSKDGDRRSLIEGRALNGYMLYVVMLEQKDSGTTAEIWAQELFPWSVSGILEGVSGVLGECDLQ